MKIKLSQLLPDDDINSRQSGRTEGIVQLAASIKELGLILPIAVRLTPGTPDYSPIGEEPFYMIVDGHRRFAAIQKLKWEDVECNVLTVDHDLAAAQSLAANIERLPLHRVDQYEAFAKLEGFGYDAKKIAKTFGLSTLQVRQVLALGKLSPKVRKAWLAGRINEEAAQAFTLTDDYALQDKALKEVLACTYTQSKWQIRRILGMQNNNPGKVLEYVGVKAYTQAGGKVTEDLFPDGDGKPAMIVSDPALLNQLSADKLIKDREALAKKYGVRLLDEDQMEAFDYEEVEGEDDDAFTQKDDERIEQYLARLTDEQKGKWWFELNCNWQSGLYLEGPYQLAPSEAHEDVPPRIDGDEAYAADADDATEIEAPVASTDTSMYTNALKQDILGWRTIAFQNAYYGQGEAFIRLMIHATTMHWCPVLHLKNQHTENYQRYTDMDINEVARLYSACIDANTGEPAVRTLARILDDNDRLEHCLLDIFDTHAGEYFDRITVELIRSHLEDMGEPAPRDWKKKALAEHAARKAHDKKWLPPILKVGLETNIPFEQAQAAE